MTSQMEIGTDRKALQINLDSAKYVTFAEIGARQEVEEGFLRPEFRVEPFDEKIEFMVEHCVE